MRHELSVSESIEINAGPSKVWNALTNPEVIKKYLYGTETITDWSVGSEIIFQGEYNGQKFKDKGIVKENIVNKLLSYKYWSGFSGLEDKPENYSLVIYELQSIDDNKIKFTWTQKGFANEKAYEHSKSGMIELLKKIKNIIEE